MPPRRGALVERGVASGTPYGLCHRVASGRGGVCRHARRRRSGFGSGFSGALMMSAPPITAGVAWAARFHSCAATHVGTVRTRNEDNFVNRPDLGIWAVADGAGGHEAGDVAAQIVTDALSEVPTGLGAAELLAEVRLRIAQAHDTIRAEAARRGEHAVLATTIVVLLAHRNHYACLWAGDSRTYLLRGGQRSHVTHDHSLAQKRAGACPP